MNLRIRFELQVASALICTSRVVPLLSSECVSSTPDYTGNHLNAAPIVRRVPQLGIIYNCWGILAITIKTNPKELCWTVTASSKYSLAKVQRGVAAHGHELRRKSEAVACLLHILPIILAIELESVSWPEDGPDGVLALQGRVLEPPGVSQGASAVINWSLFIWHSRGVCAILRKSLLCALTVAWMACACGFLIELAVQVFFICLWHYLFYIRNEI